jgi:outer membrane protein OmpA-like peptidoglycan-associated protein
MARELWPQKMFVICAKGPEQSVLVRAVPMFSRPEIALKFSEDMIPTPSSKKTGLQNTGITVHFDKNSHTVKDSEKHKLSGFSRATKEILAEKAGIVRIEGYTCDLGKQSANDVLAKKRASAVATALEQEGMKASHVIGKGRCCYVSKDPSERHLNRRVEVTITERGQ